MNFDMNFDSYHTTKIKDISITPERSLVPLWGQSLPQLLAKP